jgi:hypothetical protein
MKRQNVSRLVELVGCVFVAASPAFGQPYSLPSHVVAGGGQTSGTGGGYGLDGTVGQADASVPSQGGGYVVAGGFWAPLRTANSPFTDSVLTPGVTLIRAVHITELRTRINAVRGRYALTTYVFADSPLDAGTTIIRAEHILDLRAALSQAYFAAGLTAPTFTDSSLATRSATAVHIAEIRAALGAIE